MYFKAPVKSYYLPHTANVYSFTTEYEGNPRTKKTLIYTSIPCRAYKLSNQALNDLFGASMLGRYKIIFPTTFQSATVTIKHDYKIILTKEGRTINLKVEEVDIKDGSHLEITAVEEDV